MVWLALTACTSSSAPPVCGGCDVRAEEVVPGDGATEVSPRAEISVVVGEGNYVSVELLDSAGASLSQGASGAGRVVFRPTLEPATLYTLALSMGCGTEEVVVCNRLQTTFTTSATADGDTDGMEETDTDGVETPDLRPLDLVLVIDDSGSMLDVQARLALAMAPLQQALPAGSRVAVTTTTLDEARTTAFVDLDPAYANLTSAVRVGTEGSDFEQGLGSARLALEALELDANHRVVVTLVTDEEDCTNDGSLPVDDSTTCYTRPEALIGTVKLWTDWTLAAGRSDVEVHAVLPDAAGDCGYRSIRIPEMVERSGGVVHDLCAPDLTQAFLDIVGSTR